MAAGNQGQRGGGKPGGKKGSNKPGRRQQKPNSRLERRARRNVNIGFQPALASIAREGDQANLDFQNKDLGFQSIYGGADRELEQLSNQIGARSGEISGDLQTALSGIQGLFQQSGMPATEAATNASLGAQYGINSANTQANNWQRGVLANQSAQREGALSERYGRQNLMQDLSDDLQMLANRRADINAQKGPMILQELDRLREEKQAQAQDQAYNDLIASLIGNSLNSGGPGGGGGGGGPGAGGGRSSFNPGGGANIGPGGGTVSHANIDNFGGEGPTNPGRRIQQQVQEADYINELPGWVRYAYNHGGADALNFADRRRLYAKLAPRLRRKFGPPGGPNIDIPGPFS